MKMPQRNQFHPGFYSFVITLFILFSFFFHLPCQATPANDKTQLWQGFSISIPPDWNAGDINQSQASWNFGNKENEKYGFLKIFISRVQPQQMPLEKDATLIPQGSVIFDNKPAKAYDITFPSGDRQHHLLCLDQPDFKGNYLFIMAGVVGMDFQTNWPTLSNVLETITYSPSPPAEPTLDPSIAAQTTASTPQNNSPAPVDPSSLALDTMVVGLGTTPEGWKRVQWRNFSLAIPPEWEALGDDGDKGMGWGVVDKIKKIGVTFGAMAERKPMDQQKMDKWMTLEKEEQRLLMGKPGKIVKILGSPPKGQPEMHILGATFDSPATDGRYIIFAGSVAGDSWESNEPIILKIFASLSGNHEEDSLESSQKKAKPVQMWDVVTLTPEPGWFSFGDKDGKVWMPVFKEEPKAVLMVMRGEKVDETISKMQIKQKGKSMLAGKEASFFAGTVSYYKAPVTVWVLDHCLPSGERLGALLGGSDLKTYQKQLDTMMATLAFNLSPECGPCQEMTTRNFNGISFKAPRYLNTRTWEKLGILECKGTDLETGVKLNVYLTIKTQTYASESGKYKDEFSVVKRFKVGRAAATEFYTSINSDNKKHISRVVELDQKLSNGKYLTLECYCKIANQWELLQPIITPIISSLQVDPSLLADNAGEYRTQTPTPGDKITGDNNLSGDVKPSLNSSTAADTRPVSDDSTTTLDTVPVDTAKTPQKQTAVQGRLIWKKGFGDLVGQNEKPGFNGSADVILRLSITAPKRTITAMSLGIPGVDPLWDTLPGNQAWLLGVGQKNKLKNNANGEITIQPVAMEQVFDLYLQDKHLFDRGKTDLWLSVTFADGDVWGTPLLEK